MKNYIQIFIVALIASLIGGFAVVMLSPNSGNAPQGGITNYDQIDAADGFSVDNTIVIDGTGNVDAPITSTTGTFTGNVGFSTTTPLDIGHFENQSATSTLIISSGGTAVGGRIILEDHDGAGCSEIAILNGTIAAKTVTCPTGI